MNKYNTIIKTSPLNDDIRNKEIKQYIYNKKKDEYLHKKTMNHYIIKTKIINWLLTDLGDKKILLDFLKVSFDIILTRLNASLRLDKYKLFFTLYCNWIYKNTI